jgi:hypothetical protein
MAVLTRAALVLLVSGCFSPTGRECSVRCSARMTCPMGYTCLSDDYCHAPGDVPMCNVIDAPPVLDVTDATDPGIRELAAVADTFVQDTNGGDNFGGDVAIGIDGAVSSGSHVVGLVRFDLTSIPEGSALGSAPVLRLCTTDDPLNAGSATLYRVLEDWTEGIGVRNVDQTGDPGEANWTLRQTGTAWTTVGVGSPGSRDPTPATVGAATFAPALPDTTYSVNLEMAIVQGWIDDPTTNFGLAIVPSTDAGGAFFVSRQGANADCHPVLSVMVP